LSQKEFYSHGKLMICGEYAVLNGATSFALPSIKGQWLRVTEKEKSDDPVLIWNAKDQNNQIWFSASIKSKYLLLESCTDSQIGIQLIRFLINARALNPNFLINPIDLEVETQLEFDKEEGLGSSSTLTNNIAQWAGIDVFKLHFSAFKGSGFDVAVAHAASPILYTMHKDDPIIETLKWDKSFSDKLFFVYLNKKQNSRNEISAYTSRITTAQIAQISRISRLLSVNDDYFEFCLLLELAEKEISTLLNQDPIKKRLFSDYKGTIKSLGAWGGDFILATGENTIEYFTNKGYKHVYPYDKMIKS
jgi:mevalonate kinase